jgi:prepilin-type N-terminal cleavage/methylation domain-containing protein
MKAGRAESGFSLVELIVSLALALVVSGAAFALVGPNTTAGRTTPEMVDAQQRARVGQDLLLRDLYMAGAGLDLGPAAGPLARYFAPILARRAGLQNADAYNVARPDAITILYVPQTFSQTTLADPLPPAANFRVDRLPNCPSADALCGLGVASSVLVFDREGHFDGFTLTQVLADSGRLRPWQAGHVPYSYPAGSRASAVEWHTYYLDSATRQLRHFDGYSTDIPVVDDVVGLSVEYFGDPGPLPGLSLLSPQGGSLAALPLSLFRDGPWLGDGENRYDADLLRIRRVRVTLRLQVGNDMMRGRSSDYAVAGRSLSALGSLPDYTLRFDVSPRNMGWARR